MSIWSADRRVFLVSTFFLFLSLVQYSIAQDSDKWNCCIKTAGPNSTCQVCTETSDLSACIYKEDGSPNTEVTELLCDKTIYPSATWGDPRPIPSDIGQLVNLEKLVVTNFVTGALPEELFTLDKLNWFECYRCRRWGRNAENGIQLDPRFGAMPSMQTLRFQVIGNMNGPIPQEYFASSTLQVLNVKDTNVCGDIPQGINFRVNPDPLPPCSDTPPSASPTLAPTRDPTSAPTLAPTEAPTHGPTRAPSVTPEPGVPTSPPTNAPTQSPTPGPTKAPTVPTVPSTPPPQAGPTLPFSTTCGSAEIAIPGINYNFWIVLVLVLFAVGSSIFVAARAVGQHGATSATCVVVGSIAIGLILLNISVLLQSVGLSRPSIGVCSAEPWLLFIGAGIFFGAVWVSLFLGSNSVLTKWVGPSLLLAIAVVILCVWMAMQLPAPDACSSYTCSSSHTRGSKDPFRLVLLSIFILAFFSLAVLAGIYSCKGRRQQFKSTASRGKHTLVYTLASLLCVGLFFILQIVFHAISPRETPDYFDSPFEIVQAESQPQTYVLILSIVLFVSTIVALLHAVSFAAPMNSLSLNSPRSQDRVVEQSKFDSFSRQSPQEEYHVPQAAKATQSEERIQQALHDLDRYDNSQRAVLALRSEPEPVPAQQPVGEVPIIAQEAVPNQAHHTSNATTTTRVAEWIQSGFKIGSNGPWDEYVHRSTGEVFFINKETNEIRCDDWNNGDDWTGTQ